LRELRFLDGLVSLQWNNHLIAGGELVVASTVDRRVMRFALKQYGTFLVAHL